MGGKARNALRSIGREERHVFRAEFVRFGIKNGWTGDVPTVLFKDVEFEGRVVCDHVWFALGKQFGRLGLKCGDIVEFSARVDTYIKGYRGYREDVYKPVSKDWKLSRPTKMRKVGRNDAAVAEPMGPEYEQRLQRAIDWAMGDRNRMKRDGCEAVHDQICEAQAETTT